MDKNKENTQKPKQISKEKSDKDQLGSVLQALKDEKNLSQQKISDKIGTYINKAYRDGTSIF